VIRLRLLFALIGLANGFVMPFLVLILEGGGIGPEGIGVVLGVMALVSVVAFPVWGVLADGPLGRDRALAISGALTALAGVAMIAAHDDPLLLGAAVASTAVGSTAWGPVTDALALAALGAEAPGYGRLRLWASAGWSVSALGGGLIFERGGSVPLLIGFVVSALALGAVGALVAVPRDRAAASVPVAAGWPRWHGPDGIGSALAASPVLLGFLAAVFLESVSGQAAFSFLPLKLLDAGGSAVLVGVAAALPAIVEIPFFARSAWFTRRFGLRQLFVVGTLVAAAQFALIALVSSPALATAVRTLDGAAYALRYAGVVLIVGACLPLRLQAVGQSLAWLVAGGLAPIVAGPVAGVVYATFGGDTLFLCCAAGSAAAALLAAVVLRGPAFRVHRLLPDPTASPTLPAA
jgi:PPP family 3-phenylpropionic acid transporter